MRSANVRAIKLNRVAIVGANGIGGTLAGLLASTGAAANVHLIDLIPGLGASIATDCMHAASMMASGTRVSGSTDYSAVAGADVVIVAPDSAGYGTNAIRLLGETEMAAAAIASHAPDAVVVFSGWPSEVFTGELQRESNLPPERVIGTGATLATSRLIDAIAAVTHAGRDEIEAVALGADEAYVPILSSARLRGRPIRDAMRPADQESAVIAAAQSAAKVQSLRASHIPAIAPAYAALEVLNALRGARPGPIPVSVITDGDYGVASGVIGVTANLSLRGVKSVVEVPLDTRELEALRTAANAVREQTEALARLDI
jgi:malate dehydrogenase